MKFTCSVFLAGIFFGGFLVSADEISKIDLVPEKISNLRCKDDGHWHLASPLQPDSEGRIIASAASPDRLIIAPEEYSW